MTTQADGEFTHDEIVRYSRHILLPQVGGKGQKKLRSSRVLLAGLGGLGSAAALYLAAAGIGAIGLLEEPEEACVSMEDFASDILYSVEHIGENKAEVAARRLGALNPEVKARILPFPGMSEGWDSALAQYDLAVGADLSRGTLISLNRACRRQGIGLVAGTGDGFGGWATAAVPGRGPCLECGLANAGDAAGGFGREASERRRAVVGAVAGALGTALATEAIKLVLGIGEPLAGRILIMDGLAGEYREERTGSDPTCPTCGERA